MNRSALILPLMLASSLACSEHDSKIGAQAIAPEAAMVGERPEKSGADLYKNCVACHQADGKGMAGLAPTLVGSEWVNGNPAYVIAILQSGLEGPIEVAGEVVDIPGMASWSKPWSDQELANLLNHIRSEAFGNDGGELVTAEQAGALREPIKDRAEKWTAPELIAKYGNPREAATGAGPEDGGGTASENGNAPEPGTPDPTETPEPQESGNGDDADNAAAQDDSANAPTGDDAPAGGAGPETDGSGSPDQATDNPVPAPESTTPEAPAPTPAPAGDEGAAVGDSP